MREKISERDISRRSFIKGAGALGVLSIVPLASKSDSKVIENKIKGSVESIDPKLNHLSRPKLEVVK
ncbi:MAG: twin-arginine translocation signal domain-containing protein [Candidatus Hydrothermarchaeota archaeon]